MEQDPDYLKDENDRLLQENEGLRRQLHQAPGGGGGPVVIQKSRGNKGCTIALLVVGVGFGFIAFLSIVAAVALPMYSNFRQKTTVAVTLKEIAALEPMMINYHQSTDSFDQFYQLEMSGRDSEKEIAGAALGILRGAPGRTWRVEGGVDCLQIFFDYEEGSGCTPNFCNGAYKICYNGDQYEVVIKVGGGELGLDTSYRL